MKKLLYLAIGGASLTMGYFFVTSVFHESNDLNISKRGKSSVQTTALDKSQQSLKKDRISEPLPDINPQVAVKQAYNRYSTELESDGENLYVPVKVIEGRPVVMGDVLVEDSEGRDWKTGDRGKLPRPAYWIERKVPYRISPSLSAPLRTRILRAIEELNRVIVVRWVEHNGEEDYVLFRAGKDHCLSHVGRIGGEQPVYLSEGCEVAEILHEMLHTLGFFHEHSRPDRDEHLIVYWDNIEEQYWPQFKKIPASNWPDVDVEFDFKSLLLYAPNAFAKDPGYASLSTLDGKLFEAQRNEISALDMEKVNLLYNDL